MIWKIVLGIVIGGAFGALLGYFGKCSSGTCPLTANPYRGAFFGAIIAALLVVSFSRSSQRQSQDPALLAAEKELLVHIESESDFKRRVLEGNGIYLVDLFSDRCPPCRALAPIIVSLAKKYSGEVAVCKVDVDRVPSVARRYGIRGIPTVLIISSGKEVKRLVGLQPETAYSYHLDELVREIKNK